MHRLIGTVVMSVVLHGVLAYGQADSPFERLPLWPADGHIGAELMGKYVFRDPATAEVVVSFPEDFSDPDGPRRIERWRPNNQTDARISTLITKEPEDIYEYEFAISNGPRARQPIQFVAVIYPSEQGLVEVHHPTWGGIRSKHSVLRQVAAPWLPPPGSGSTATWASYGLGPDILPGERSDGFVVRCRYRPGFTTVYVSGGRGSFYGPPLPKEVIDQLIPVWNIHVNSQTFLILGPRFDANASSDAILTDYRLGLEQLVRTGVLAAESPGLERLVAFLDACTKSDPRACMAGQLAVMLEQIAAGPEREIAAALRLALEAEKH